MTSEETMDTGTRQNPPGDSPFGWQKLPSSEAKSLFGLYRKRFGAAGEMNYFGQPFISSSVLAMEDENFFGVLDVESDFSRLYFAIKHVSALGPLCISLPDSQIVTDYITRDEDKPTPRGRPGAIQEAFAQSGFRELAQYRRMACATPYRVKSKGSAERAEIDEATALYERLLRDFDPRLDHLPGYEKFLEFVEGGQVIVKREGGNIRGYFVFENVGSKSHMNYWAADEDLAPSRKLGLILQYYSEMTRVGIKSVYCWVDSRNATVIRLHERFGLRFDGTRDFIFERTANNAG